MEEPAIFPVLDSMGLTGGDRGCVWFDHLLLNIGGYFIEFPAIVEHEKPTLALFYHLVYLPCNDSFLKSLAFGEYFPRPGIELQKWLINRSHEPGHPRAPEHRPRTDESRPNKIWSSTSPFMGELLFSRDNLEQRGNLAILQTARVSASKFDSLRKKRNLSVFPRSAWERSRDAPCYSECTTHHSPLTPPGRI